ncbi:methionyl-tRNA formyltransferase [Brevibacterium luteolum]|uniref:methionyl-tRNA formyltransferase n=1 Tax=Brevibacterium luteolum TaxID=199591 RepID=UPI0021AEAE55|nr:methionyl-tRNA formyltransferase [Brevibacterium luteolum]MCT1828562.1 methionyl-tRNA formyltransferase [Brevibacterium luteolum]
MRIVFAGTPAVAVPALEALLESDHEVIAVLTRPDAPVGRKRVLTPSPVKERALATGIPVLEAARLRGEILDELEALGPDAVAVVAFGAIAGPRALSISEHGWYNLHFSLLPQWRGAAPVQRALMAGQTTSGVTVFRIDTGMDTGPVLTQQELDLPSAPAGEVLDSYARTGAELLVTAFDQLADGSAELTPQHGETSHAEKITPDEAELPFTATTAELVARANGVTPAPGPWALMDGKRTKLSGITAADDLSSAAWQQPGRLAAAADGTVLIGTSDGAVAVERIQPFGKAMMDAADFLRGRGQAAFDISEEPGDA